MNNSPEFRFIGKKPYKDYDESLDWIKQDMQHLTGKALAYFERDQLVAALSKNYPSHLCKHPIEDLDWESDWRNIVCIHLPEGLAAWHIHDSEVKYFAHLNMKKNHWDGHDNIMKYNRLKALNLIN